MRVLATSGASPLHPDFRWNRSSSVGHVGRVGELARRRDAALWGWWFFLTRVSTATTTDLQKVQKSAVYLGKRRCRGIHSPTEAYRNPSRERSAR